MFILSRQFGLKAWQLNKRIVRLFEIGNNCWKMLIFRQDGSHEFSGVEKRKQVAQAGK